MDGQTGPNLAIPYFARPMNTHMLMHLHNVYGYFHTTEGEYVASSLAEPKQIAI